MPSGSRKRRMMSDINVVPYIDVMLVLLIIFMITTPLLTQGVKVNLPKASAKPLQVQQDETPVVLTVTSNGDYYLNIGEHPSEPVDAQLVVATVAAVLKLRPKTHVLVRGDQNARYDEVLRGMTLLQAAGAPSVGLETNPNNPPRVQIKKGG